MKVLTFINTLLLIGIFFGIWVANGFLEDIKFAIWHQTTLMEREADQPDVVPNLRDISGGGQRVGDCPTQLGHAFRKIDILINTVAVLKAELYSRKWWRNRTTDEIQPRGVPVPKPKGPGVGIEVH